MLTYRIVLEDKSTLVIAGPDSEWNWMYDVNGTPGYTAVTATNLDDAVQAVAVQLLRESDWVKDQMLNRPALVVTTSLASWAFTHEDEIRSIYIQFGE